MTTRLTSFIVAVVGLTCLVGAQGVRTAAPVRERSDPPVAQSPLVRAAVAASAAEPVKAPLLWRIDGPVPSYLYGTIHVPDQAVVDLPASVQQAFGAAAAVFTEIPMDGATQLGVMNKVLLPADQTLSDILGPTLYARFSDAVQRSLPKDAPAAMGSAITAMLGRMKPWAAMSQLALIEFLPDMMAGRKPLDSMLYDRAKSEGKETGALETADEQLAVFEGFTIDEQVRMLKLTLDSMDEAHKAGRSATRELIEGYKSGDLQKLSAMATESMRAEPELFGKFMARALDGRNRVMADRILARRAERPDKVCFFAIGALHYAGEVGIVSLLEKKGLKITRVSAP
jgi:uncharacterized protein YbaP (TraB family)